MRSCVVLFRWCWGVNAWWGGEILLYLNMSISYLYVFSLNSMIRSEAEFYEQKTKSLILYSYFAFFNSYIDSGIKIIAYYCLEGAMCQIAYYGKIGNSRSCYLIFTPRFMKIEIVS